MTPRFFHGQRLRAAALNELRESADAAHLGGASYLSADNGFEQVVRNPRRSAPAARPAAAADCQWRLSAKWDAEAGAAAVSVAPGVVAWGGGQSATWAQTGESVGSVPAGEKRLVVWSTASPPRPLKYDPRWPEGDGAPACGCDDCDCHRATGDPNGGEWVADPGAVALVEEGAAAPEDATDSRLIGVVEVSDSGRVTVTQWQRDTIVARAIVGARPGKAEDPDDAAEDEPPPCGNPMNEGGGAGVEENPLDEDGGTGGGDDESDDRDRDPTPPGGTDDNPLDKPGDGGYTPACRDVNGNENDY